MKAISDKEFENQFDAGEDITEYLDLSSAQRPNLERIAARRISMDIPERLVRGLDYVAQETGVNRQALIKLWLKERLDDEIERMLARRAQVSTLDFNGTDQEVRSLVAG